MEIYLYTGSLQSLFTHLIILQVHSLKADHLGLIASISFSKKLKHLLCKYITKTQITINYIFFLIETYGEKAQPSPEHFAKQFSYAN